MLNPSTSAHPVHPEVLPKLGAFSNNLGRDVTDVLVLEEVVSDRSLVLSDIPASLNNLYTVPLTFTFGSRKELARSTKGCGRGSLNPRENGEKRGGEG